MPKVDLYNINGEVVGDFELSSNVFGVEVNSVAIHSVVLNQLANKRQGTFSTKTKSEVRGGGKKPWKQKGTGRARQGSTRSAQWIKGGIIFGPKPRSFRYSLPKKLRRVALKSALSTKVAEKEILVLDELKLENIKTREMAKILNKLNTNNTLIVISENDSNIIKSARNIPGVKTALVSTLNVYDIMKYEKFIITKDAVSKVEEVYA